mgnify:CR=1 FL=1
MDTSGLVESLISGYASLALKEKPKTIKASQLDLAFLQQIGSLADSMYKYQVPQDLDRALESIDLASIYEGVDRREKDAEKEAAKGNVSKLAYEDYIVLEVLHYFKNSFFTWINKPKCPNCEKDGDNIINKGALRFPTGKPNPKQIMVIENYECTDCKREIQFPRINSAVALLETRSGRCGEWVNCFILILQAILGPDQQIRYLWNYEDHVWCEYYSNALNRWVHLDPCEAVADEPLLYCNNWGKQMSWVFGFGLGYAVDLSSKYIVPEKQLSQTHKISSKQVVEDYLAAVNFQLQHKYLQLIKNTNSQLTEKQLLVKIYQDVILKRNVESKGLEPKPLPSTSLPKGRQSGSATWTAERGEAGK